MPWQKSPPMQEKLDGIQSTAILFDQPFNLQPFTINISGNPVATTRTRLAACLTPQTASSNTIVNSIAGTSAAWRLQSEPGQPLDWLQSYGGLTIST